MTDDIENLPVPTSNLPAETTSHAGNSADFWDKRYAEKSYFYGTEPNSFLEEIASAVSVGYPQPRAFVPGDGEGRNGAFLAGLGYAVTSLDISKRAVEKANTLAEDLGVDLDAEVGDLMAFDWPKKRFDLIALIFVQFPPEQQRQLHKKVAEALKPGGMLILEGFSKGQLKFKSGGPKDLDMLFDIETIEADFEPVLDIDFLECDTRRLNEGKRHRGRAETVQLVAVKL